MEKQMHPQLKMVFIHKNDEASTLSKLSSVSTPYVPPATVITAAHNNRDGIHTSIGNKHSSTSLKSHMKCPDLSDHALIFPAHRTNDRTGQRVETLTKYRGHP